MNFGAAAKREAMLSPSVVETSPMGAATPATGIMAAAGAAMAKPAATPAMQVRPQNPAEPPMPATGVDFGGTNDPQMNEWLNQQAGMLDFPRHPKTGHFLAGPFKRKTPGQVREQLIQDYRAGRRSPVAGHGSGAGEGGGLRTGTMTGKSSFTPDDVWRNMTKPGQIARPASTLPGSSNALSPASVAASPAGAMGPAAGIMTAAARTAVAAPKRALNPAEPEKELIARR
jgi:hypothetical protein